MVIGGPPLPMSEMGDKRIALLLLKKSRHHQRSWRLRQATLVVGFFLVVYCLLYALRTPLPSPHRLRPALTHELLNNLSLDEDQCKAAFPGLTKEVDDVVALGPFVVKQAGDLGPLQGRIKNGQIEIIHAQRPSDISQEMRNSRTASLHQIYRAILTSPSPIPDTIFSLNFQDQPFGTAFTYSRSATSSHLTSTTKTSSSRRDFLIPHFSFWAWPLPFIGSMSRAASAISALESSYPDSRSWRTAKIPKAVWRGTAWYSSVTSPGLRQNLLRATKNQPWADVEQLKWNAKTAANASNALQIEDFCRYKYIIHTEGVSYSGRFQFLQMCKSVVITPPIQWMQHLTHLVKPLFSSTLDLEGEGTKKWELTGAMKRTWPVQYEPEEANMVFVNRDWSDLGATVKWLEEHPDIAEGIAQRQRELFVGGGYFSPAAETCYWRALIRGWASVAQTKGQGWEDAEGVSFEQFVLTNTK